MVKSSSVTHWIAKTQFWNYISFYLIVFLCRWQKFIVASHYGTYSQKDSVDPRIYIHNWLNSNFCFDFGGFRDPSFISFPPSCPPYQVCCPCIDHTKTVFFSPIKKNYNKKLNYVHTYISSQNHILTAFVLIQYI